MHAHAAPTRAAPATQPQPAAPANTPSASRPHTVQKMNNWAACTAGRARYRPLHWLGRASVLTLAEKPRASWNRHFVHL